MVRPQVVQATERAIAQLRGNGLEVVHSPDLLPRIVRIIEQEQTCCSFLRFQIVAEPERGPTVLEVTGPEGTRELLRSL